MQVDLDMIKGQDKLLNRINKFDYTSFPQASIFEGTTGCGKHTLVEYLSDKFNIPIEDISGKISNDMIMDIYTKPNPTLYIIDMLQLNKSKRIDIVQNSLLKFIEEPPTNSKVIILCENKDNLLSTIQNRCQIFSFEKYNYIRLKQFTEDNDIKVESEDLFCVYDTPGKLLNMTNEVCFSELKSLVDKVIDNIVRASIPNILTIPSKLNFDNSDGYDIDVFLHLMSTSLLNRMTDCSISNEEFNYLKKQYTCTCKVCEKIKMFNVNKKALFENYLMELKGVI